MDSRRKISLLDESGFVDDEDPDWFPQVLDNVRPDDVTHPVGITRWPPRARHHAEGRQADHNDVTVAAVLEEAVEAVRDIILALAHRLLELRAELTHVCTHLDLTESETETTLRYADALEMWLGGYEPWHRNSLRYSQAMTQRPVSGPRAHEDLLGNAAQLRTRVTCGVPEVGLACDLA